MKKTHVRMKDILRHSSRQILLVFLAFLIMVVVSYAYVSDIVEDKIQALGEETMNTTEVTVSMNLTETEMIFSNFCQTVESMLTNKRSNEQILNFMENMNTYFSGQNSMKLSYLKVYGQIRGEFLDGSGWVPPVDYEPTQRPWYYGAKDTRTIYFSQPYEDADTLETCISFSKGMYDARGEFFGVLAIDLNLTEVIDSVHALQLEGGGYGVLLGNDLIFVGHRDKELIGTHIAEAGGDYAMLAARIEAEEPVIAEHFTDFDGTESIAFFRPIFNGWYIGLVTPKGNYYGQVYMMGVVLACIGLVLTAILSYLLVRMRLEKLRSDEESLSKSNFLSHMSHEMRTPMNAIIGMADIAQHSRDMDRVQYCVTRIQGASTHLLGIINDVLDMSKIEAGKLTLSEDVFDLRDMVERMLSLNSVKFDEKRQKLLCDIEESAPKAVIADEQRLAQVMMNLLSNANKFTPEGGEVRLKIQGEKAQDGGMMLRVSVADSGIGIEEAEQERLFQPFEQASADIAKDYGGSGLGLAISRRIVQAMGGEISLTSTVGKGSTFVFTARVRVASSAPVKPHSAEEERTYFPGKRLLVVEDVEINCEILEAQLENSGLRIDFAENGKIACEMFNAAHGRYDLIFMDIQMPVMDGYEATRNIRAQRTPGAKEVPIIAMTANVFKEDVERALSVGMNDHLGKPVDIRDVFTKLNEFL